MRGLRRGNLLGRVVLLGLGILGLGRRGRGIERDESSFFSFILFCWFWSSIAYHYTTYYVCTHYGWMGVFL